jgi:amino acid adenylation domain-containing protein
MNKLESDKFAIVQFGESIQSAAISNAAFEQSTVSQDPDVTALFEEQAALRPDSVALISDAEQVTYRELNERANQLAHYLISRGVQNETLVGVFLRRSIEMVVALLGILKAGGAYVPLDPDYPSERVGLLLNDIQAALVVTDSSCSSILPRSPAEVVKLDTDSSWISAESLANPGITRDSKNLIYIMYTSGTTGQSKGAMIEHRGVVRLVKNTDYANLDSSERFLQMAPISFDASTLEIWAPLLNGGSLVLMRSGRSSLEEIGEMIRRHNVTSVWLPTGLFNLMVDQHADKLLPLRQLITGGDTGSIVHFRKALEKLPGVRLINGYGPTETTTFAVCLTVHPEHLSGSSVPIGYPIANTDVWILDTELSPVAKGGTGEIYIGGPGVARGYLNRPELTAERFVSPPWAYGRSAKLYRTGDLARWRSDGTIEHLGRIDDQVKLSGYRVEPGEVATHLREHPSVRDAIVVVDQDSEGHKRLLAYVVPRSRPAPHGQELRQFLLRKLPQFMVPAEFVTLQEIPLTHNGKPDRSALPRQARSTMLAPSVTASESLAESIANVWRTALRVESVSLHDNFFDLGGSSLLLISVHSKLQSLVGRKFPVTDLFEFPTVASIAGRLGSSDSHATNTDDAQARARRQREMLSRRSQSPAAAKVEN